MVGLLSMGCTPSPAGTSSLGDAGPAGRDVANRGDGSSAQHPDLPGTVVCSGDPGAANKGNAEACTCNNECRSGFCVDGVCCSSACTEGCKACNLPSSLGDCSFIPSGVNPVQSGFCSASTPSTCGQDGTCDGKGACRKFVAGIECKPGTCDGDGVSGAKACDGNGNCSTTVSTPCGNYACDSATSKCAEACTTDAQCAAGQQCALGSCGIKLNGFDCNADSDCASGHCADHKCCNVACNGACLSCNQPGSVGRCNFVDQGLPHSACMVNSASTCGTTGLCDGVGACAIFPENTPCGAASCAGDVLLNSPRVCDGQGTCRAAQLVDCSPYLCSAGDCNGSCSSDADCQPGHQCVTTTVRGLTTGRCGQKKNGQSCSSASDCESNQCVDGVCCESACEGACRSCALPGSPGHCVNVAASAVDPRQTCQDSGKSLCGTTGLCDGNGACQKYASGTVCAPEICQAGAHTPAATCDQSGNCVTPLPIQCNPFTCNASSCYIACSNDSQCVPGNFCVNASCGLKPLGAECSLAKECQSGHCAQGTCCNSDCTGSCLACNLSASLGLCTAVADGAPDPQEKCKATAQATCGTTGLCKAGACANYAKGLNCKNAVCATGTSQTPASTCDGLGACVTPANLDCGRFICSSAACESTCKSSSDCVSPNICQNNSCGLKKGGAICTAGKECESTFCTDSYCCDKACTGNSCMSCKVASKEGTCSIVATDCIIDGVCYPANAVNPSNQCQQCLTAVSQTAWTAKPDQSPCNDGKACTRNDVCTAGTCGGTSYTCPTPDQCHQDGTGVCNGDGTCSFTNKTNGTACSDGNACTQTDTCQTGVCTGSNPVTCVASDQCHTVGTCSTSTGVCSNPAKANGTTCNDGNACTQADTCQAGVCTGSNPVTCPTPDQCHTAGSCDTGTGVCTNPAKANGAACNDGNACTQLDTCQAGACTGSNPVTCAAPDQCHTAGTCDTSTGVCSNPAKANGSQCNDGNACTQNDSCTGGLCAGDIYTCLAPAQCHQAGVCLGDGTCSFAISADGDVCTGSPSCRNSHTAVLANGLCSTGVCNLTTQACVTGYLCVVAACVAPGNCSSPGDCDTVAGYTCQSGTCTLGTGTATDTTTGTDTTTTTATTTATTTTTATSTGP